MNIKEKFIKRELEQNYYKYRELLYHYIFQRLKSEKESEQIITDIFYYLDMLVRSGEHISYTDDNFPTLLFVLTKYQIKNHQRKSPSLWKQIRLFLGKHFLFPSEIEQLLDLISYTDAKNCLEGLPEKYIDVIFLKWGVGLSVKAISDILGIAEITVQKRIRYGKKYLYRYIKKWQPDLLKAAELKYSIKNR